MNELWWTCGAKGTSYIFLYRFIRCTFGFACFLQLIHCHLKQRMHVTIFRHLTNGNKWLHYVTVNCSTFGFFVIRVCLSLMNNHAFDFWLFTDEIPYMGKLYCINVVKQILKFFKDDLCLFHCSYSSFKWWATCSLRAFSQQESIKITKAYVKTSVQCSSPAIRSSKWLHMPVWECHVNSVSHLCSL